MSLPVLIPARNEADHIGRALAGLPREVEPIVLPNGCTDNTAEIAREYGATVLPDLQEGKLLAIQEGITHLGRRATEPFITMDADTFPLMSRYYARAMGRGLLQLADVPAVVVGPVLFTGGPGLAANTWRSMHRYGRQLKSKTNDFDGYFAGMSMLIHPRTQKVVDALLGLEHFWPGEDYAIKDVIVDNGGSTYKTPNPLAAVVTDAVRTPSLRQKFFEDKAAVTALIKQSYKDDCPPGARRYFRPAPNGVTK